MKIKYAILFALMCSPVMAAEKFDYKENTFTEKDSCIGADRGTSLVPKEKFWRFLIEGSIEDGKTPFSGEVAHIISAAKAKEKLKISIIMTANANPLYDEHTAYWEAVKEAEKDKPLWDEIGCFHTLDARYGQPETLARLTPAYRYSLGVAIRGLPASAWVLEPSRKPVPMAVKDNPYVKLVRHMVTDACYGPDSRIEVGKSSMLNGRSIVDLVIGRAKNVSPEKKNQLVEKESLKYQTDHYKRFPEYKKEQIDGIKNKVYFESVEICRFYLDGDRVLKYESYSRASGVDKDWGDDVQLDSKGWPFIYGHDLGFISMDEGKNWDLVTTYSGRESSSYQIESLDNPSTVRFSGGLTQLR